MLPLPYHGFMSYMNLSILENVFTVTKTDSSDLKLLTNAPYYIIANPSSFSYSSVLRYINDTDWYSQFKTTKMRRPYHYVYVRKFLYQFPVESLPLFNKSLSKKYSP